MLGASQVLFHVPMLGSVPLLYLCVLLFIAANLALGITFSSIARNQLQAMQMTFFFFLPSMLLSGFMFPFRGMPEWAQWIGSVLPLTHFLQLVRGIMLKGNDAADALAAHLADPRLHAGRDRRSVCSSTAARWTGRHLPGDLRPRRMLREGRTRLRSNSTRRTLRLAEAREVVRGRAPVRGVVVVFQQPRHQRGPLARGGERLPLADPLPAVQGDQAIELRAQRRQVAEEMPVLVHQQRHARGGIGLQQQAFARAHARDERIGNLQLADLF